MTPDDASFPATRLVAVTARNGWAAALSFGTIVATVVVVVTFLMLRVHVDLLLAPLVIGPLVAVMPLLAAGLRRFAAWRLRRRAVPAQVVFTEAGIGVRSATASFELPWPPVLYLQQQGETACTITALSTGKREVLSVGVPAERIRAAVERHSAGRTRAPILRLSEASYGLRDLAAAFGRTSPPTRGGR